MKTLLLVLLLLAQADAAVKTVCPADYKAGCTFADIQKAFDAAWRHEYVAGILKAAGVKLESGKCVTGSHLVMLSFPLCTEAGLRHLTICLLLAGSSAFGQDAEGCKDSPLVPRMQGSRLAGCEQKEFDEFNVITGVDKDENAIEKKLAGAHASWDYEGREGLTPVQVFRNYQNALKDAGFRQIYGRSPDYQAAQKGNTWVVVDTSGGAAHNIHVVTVQGLNQEITVDASGLQNEMEKSGRVSVYGIQFETGKAAILPASEQTLGEVAKMLQQAGDLKVRVEGHTDNVGAKALNDRLSLERAQAVVAWLVAHGVSAARMQAQGFGDAKPVADNSTEEGRAKNRRVDLVKQ